MELTKPQIIIAIIVFLIITIILTRATYKHYKKESGPHFWNKSGGQTNYFRVLVLLSMGLTIIAMLILTELDLL